jgi:carbon-monoxide dehydrogenase medium subunit
MIPAVGFHAATSVAEACTLLAEREDARPVSGGTALAILMRQGLVRPGLLVGVGRIPELRQIQANGHLRLGAAVPLRVVENDPAVLARWPVIADTLRRVASVRVRNMATIGGGLAHADPAQDPPATFVALGADVLVAGPKGERRIPAEQFFVDYYETALQPGEIVTGVEVPPLADGAGAAFIKYTPRSVDDYATVSTAALVELGPDGTCRAARLALAAVGNTPVAVDVASVLVGQPLTEASAREAAELARNLVDPVDDVRGSAEYKRDMAVVFGRRALLAAAHSAASDNRPAAGGV